VYCGGRILGALDVYCGGGVAGLDSEPILLERMVVEYLSMPDRSHRTHGVYEHTEIKS
jgi:hypothetical protein